MGVYQKAERIQAELAARGLSGTVRELPDSARTAQLAAEALGVQVAQIAKSLVFTLGDQVILAIASGVNRVSMDRLAEQLGAEPEQPDAKTVKRLTGFSVGGVPPIGHQVPVVTFLDEDLLRHETVWAAAGHPKAVFPIAPDALVTITGGKVVTLAE